ncbi:hypothetical protein PRIPAC_89965 [Pristionchus pacificus]|uniref:Membrane transporter n=1 Tax=Pristionchus pacificus TaxID=54126 RepID=A0A2A6CJ87_PRIPA|nr:hypothetical protein PRIPAC_89965 [Pristionchus pacificus]|eukprot:PDM78137.1 membrane transporter [Pristionchus pacificus]
MFFNRFRFLLCIVSFFALASIYSNQIIINFTFICMTNDANDTITLSDGSVRQRYDYSTKEKSMILSSIGIGTMLATFPITHLIAKVGARHPFYLFGLFSCIVTALIPWAARTHFWMLILFRFFQGIAYASDFTTIGKICVEWAPLREISFFIGFLTVFNFWSSVITNPISAWLCESSLGWEWSFYAHSIVGSVIFTIWWLIYRDDPRYHVVVTEKELNRIHKNKSEEHKDAKRRDVPYWEIIKNKTVIVCWVSAFLDITSTILLVTYAPIYFHKVLKFDVSTTGILVSIVSFSQLPFKTAFCITSDRMNCMPERWKMLFYNFFAFVLCGIFYAAIAITPWREMIVVLFCLVAITSSANCGSFYKCDNFVARQHAHFVISAIQFSKCVSLFAAPAIVGVLVDYDEDVRGWNEIFLGFGALLILAHFVFWAVVTEEPADFTKSRSEESIEKTDMTTVPCSTVTN